MDLRNFNGTPELTMADSLPSSPESVFSHFEPSEASPKYIAQPIPIDPDLANVLRLFVENAFEEDKFSQPYLSLLSDAQKDQLKAQVFTSHSLMMAAQRSSASPDPDALSWSLPDPDSEISDRSLTPTPWRNRSRTPTTVIGRTDEEDLVFSPLDPCSYFEFRRGADTEESTRGTITNEDLAEFFSQLPKPQDRAIRFQPHFSVPIPVRGGWNRFNDHTRPRHAMRTPFPA